MRTPEPQALLFHKPKGLVVTRRDERGRRTIYDALPDWVLRDDWIPVGRLDRDTRGLILMVKDRRLADRWAAPGRLHKVYEVWVRGRVTDEHLQRIRTGIPSPVGLLTCVETLVLRSIGPKTVLRIVLAEGKNRHIRRMFGSLPDPVHGTPLKVVDLKRTQFGPIVLDVSSGQWRFLNPEETERLDRL